MPEIAEVARIVHFLREHLVGYEIVRSHAPDDPILFGKAGTSGPAFEEATLGKTVTSAGSQGKYFWITLSSPPHIVMHLGMTGWIHIQGERTAYTNYYKKAGSDAFRTWPPRYTRFELEIEVLVGHTPPTARRSVIDRRRRLGFAFTDPRRFGRVRLVDCPAAEIRANPPLCENGPDPVVDAAVVTKEFVREKMCTRHVPVKALLLDQQFVSGIGNWVADEVLFQAQIHPEQYTDSFDDAEITRLHEKILSVCQTAVEKLGNSDDFPKDWLFHYRWEKGRKSASRLPTGETLAFLKVGGRTSCYCPDRQKNTGAVVRGVKEEPLSDSGELMRAPKGRKRGKSTPTLAKEEEEEEEEEEDEEEEAPKRKKSRVARAIKEEEGMPERKKGRAGGSAKKEKGARSEPGVEEAEPVGERRSARLARR